MPVPGEAITDEHEGATKADADDAAEVRVLISPSLVPLLISFVQIVRLQSAHLPLFNAALASSIRDGPIRGLESVFSSDAWDAKDVMVIHVYFFPYCPLLLMLT